MITESHIITHLLQYPALTDWVGERIYPYGLLPQSTDGQVSAQLPALTVSLIRGEGHYTTSAVKPYEVVRAQIDIWGTTGATVSQIYNAIDAILDGYRGGISTSEAGGVFRNTAPPLAYDSDIRLYRAILDYSIHLVC
jgi:hypothetical protein